MNLTHLSVALGMLFSQLAPPPPRPSAPAVFVHESVIDLMDALVRRSQREGMERSACLLGALVGDSLFIEAAIEGLYTKRSRDELVFWCPQYITVGTWHSHVADGNMRHECGLSEQDFFDFGRHHHYWVVAQSHQPFQYCAWVRRYDGKMARLLLGRKLTGGS